MPLHTYLPQDRLRVLANNTTLPDRISGSALFADISGFTALTESLRESLGARQGAEELSRRLGAVYSALIAEIEKYCGSVIGFAGDAMMCWFNASRGDAGQGLGVGMQGSGVGAVSCAFGMQQAIQAFPELGLKVAITSGAARRFVVGDPEIQKLDALAGATVARASTAEHHAVKGDVLVDEVTANALGSAVVIKEWRSDGDSGEKFAVVTQGAEIGGQGAEKPEPQSPTPDSQVLRSWVHHAVYDRETSGSTFLTEFRPCVALFVKFTGIDFDSDSAEAELNTFIQQVQKTAKRFEGTLMDITIGDKGSYAYVNFGALSAHEDDTRRAVKTALELRKCTDLQLQMGITQGTLRVGAFGGATRRTFGAIGDDVNLAARLMTTATTGEILISGRVQKAIANDFVSEPRAPLPMKGKAEPLPVFALTEERKQRAIRLQEPTYALPMVGRIQELGIINDKLELAINGQAQVIGIVAEAGMGKSRLVAEVIRSARKKGFAGYGGACQSDAVNTPYQAWKSIWQAFFDVDPSAPLKKQIRFLESEIEDKAPERTQALPLLGIVLDLDIPDNDFTKTLEPQYRQSVLRALLEDCLRATAKEEPLLIVLEDLHWIDALSHDLTEGLARTLSDSRICFLLAYRPPQLARLTAPRLEALPNFTKIELHELNAAEAEQAVRAKLAQLYPARSGALPVGLVDKLMARAQGNPFYLEELLNHVRDRGLDPAGLDQIELPDSLHTLILSRIDALTEGEKTTLRVASIVGRLFRAQWLTGYYPDLGELSTVKSNLDQMAKMDITSLDTPEPELAYLFKHIVTHEVTYESLPFATRAKLHEQLAVYLESIGAPVEAIAHHYGLSHNTAKQHEYWLKAGNAAYEAFANEAALDYYNRLAPLSDPQEQVDLNLKRAGAHYALGRLAEARQHLHLVLDGLGEPLPTTGWRVGGGLLREIALQIWHRLGFAIRPIFDEVGSETPEINAGELGLTRAYELLTFVNVLANQVRLADVYNTLRALNVAESWRRKSPALARSNAVIGVASALLPVPMHALARVYLRRARATLVGLDHPPSLAFVLSEMGLYAIGIGKWEESKRVYQQALEIHDRLGDRRNWAVILNALGFLAYFRGQFENSIKLYADIYKEGLASNNVEHQAWGLNGQAMNLFRLGKTTQATDLLERALPLFAVITDSSLTELLSQGMLAIVHLRQGRFEQARQAADSANRLLAQASIPIFTALDTYGSVANVYLVLWEKSQTQLERSRMEILAQQACRSLHQFARIYSIAQSQALLWQGIYDWLDGKPGRAHRAWRKSLAAARKLGMPYDEACAYYEIGRHTTGEERDANLARANEIFERLGVVGFEVQS